MANSCADFQEREEPTWPKVVRSSRNVRNLHDQQLCGLPGTWDRQLEMFQTAELRATVFFLGREESSSS